MKYTPEIIKGILKQYPYIYSEIKFKKAELEELRELKQDIQDTCKAASYSLMPKGSGKSDTALNALLEIERDDFDYRINLLKEEISLLTEKKNFIDELLKSIPPHESIVVRMHFIEGHTLEYIAIDTKKSLRWTKELQYRALEKMAYRASV